MFLRINLYLLAKITYLGILIVEFENWLCCDFLNFTNRWTGGNNFLDIYNNGGWKIRFDEDAFWTTYEV